MCEQGGAVLLWAVLGWLVGWWGVGLKVASRHMHKSRTSEVAGEEGLPFPAQSLVTSASLCRGFHIVVSAWALEVRQMG